MVDPIEELGQVLSNSDATVHVRDQQLADNVLERPARNSTARLMPQPALGPRGDLRKHRFSANAIGDAEQRERPAVAVGLRDERHSRVAPYPRQLPQANHGLPKTRKAAPEVHRQMTPLVRSPAVGTACFPTHALGDGEKLSTSEGQLDRRHRQLRESTKSRLNRTLFSASSARPPGQPLSLRIGNDPHRMNSNSREKRVHAARSLDLLFKTGSSLDPGTLRLEVEVDALTPSRHS
mmetsp:Transcript_42212/g.100615  ORF Transcript_42212/g.100615 Transcript_42212/m.100615 type:complete len:236 (-) Transcript_42212:10958-11665(-)